MGSDFSNAIFSFDAIKAPTGIPPPIALPIAKISGTISKFINPNNLPVRPNPGCISSKINRAPTSSHLFLTFFR